MSLRTGVLQGKARRRLQRHVDGLKLHRQRGSADKAMRILSGRREVNVLWDLLAQKIGGKQ